MPPFALTIYWHWSLKGRKNHGHKSTELYFLIIIEGKKIISKDQNGESKQWHERPAIFKFNLKSILVLYVTLPCTTNIAVSFALLSPCYPIHSMSVIQFSLSLSFAPPFNISPYISQIPIIPLFSASL